VLIDSNIGDVQIMINLYIRSFLVDDMIRSVAQRDLAVCVVPLKVCASPLASLIWLRFLHVGYMGQITML
jgi:hypothetical protein